LMLKIYLKFKPSIKLIQIPAKVTPFIIVFGFILMFSIPFFTGRFIEQTRYTSLLIPYTRYIGILIIPAITGLVYLILKSKKNIPELFILISAMILTMLIFEQTYMKWFLPVIVIPFAGIGIMNITKLSTTSKFALTIVSIFLIFTIVFSSFYQLYIETKDPFNERYIEESTYNTGRWMKQNLNGLSISNNNVFGERIFAASETSHLITSITSINAIYGFDNINISNYTRYPINSDNFWFSGYKGPDPAEMTWINLHRMIEFTHGFNVNYIIENRKIDKGTLFWNHGSDNSPLLRSAYGENRIYDTGNINIWKLY